MTKDPELHGLDATASENVSQSKVEFLKKIGKFSAAAIGAMVLAGTLAASGAVQAAETGTTQKFTKTKSQITTQQSRIRGSKYQQMFKGSQFKGQLGTRGISPAYPSCW